MRISLADDSTFVVDDRRPRLRSYTLPPSPSYSRSPSSSSSSDFEFLITSSATAAIDLHPRSSVSADDITPADDLFYKGKILPLQLTPRLSMVKSLFFDSSSSVSSASANSRYSTGSSSSSDAAMCREDAPSSFADLAEDDGDFIITELTSAGQSGQSESQSQSNAGQPLQRKSKPFSIGMKLKLSSVFKTEPRMASQSMTTSAAASGTTSAARDVMRKYMNKVKPFYEKMARRRKVLKRGSAAREDSVEVGTFSDELFSGHLMKYRNNKQGVAISCPASIRSSPCHSCVLSRAPVAKSDSSSEELQSAIQGAIAHCKNSMLKI